MQTPHPVRYSAPQHRFQDDVERSLLGAGGSYARPSSRSQANQREREHDQQLLQEALSLYLASAQPSHRHRGGAPIAPAGERESERRRRSDRVREIITCFVMRRAGLPYYDDLELEMPLDYVEDYTLEERLGGAARQPQQKLQNKKVHQGLGALPERGNGE